VKEVPFRRVTVTLGRVRELYRLNPRGKVPVLVQGSEIVADSDRIARHLEARYPEPGLIPADPQARAYATLLESWADGALHFVVGGFKWLNPANRAAALANTAGEVAGGLLGPVVGRVLLRRERRRYAAWGYTAETLGRLEGRMREDLAVLGALLAGKPYLLGRSPTLADIAAFAQLSWMDRYREGHLLHEAPAVAEWCARLAAVPPIAAALSS
jgi:glutathione S-transferase